MHVWFKKKKKAVKICNTLRYQKCLFDAFFSYLFFILLVRY